MPYHTNGNNNGAREKLYTNGGEYKCQRNDYPGCGNGANGTYVGSMHYHPSKGYMVGATHSEQSHPILMPVNGSYNSGGPLMGPSHTNGGIPARVDGGEVIELEGGEFIINAQTAKAVGEGFLNKLNSTATTHHVGGYQQGQLPRPSMYKNGGKVPNRRNKMRRGGKPVRRKSVARGRRQMANGGNVRRQPVVRGRRQMANGGTAYGARGNGNGNMTTRNMASRRNGNSVVTRNSVGGSTQFKSAQCPNPQSLNQNYIYYVMTPPTLDGSSQYFCCLDNFRSENCEKVDGRKFIKDLIKF